MSYGFAPLCSTCVTLNCLSMSFPLFYTQTEWIAMRAPLLIVDRLVKIKRGSSALPSHGLFDIYLGFRVSNNLRRLVVNFVLAERIPALLQRLRSNLQRCGLALRSITHKRIRKEAQTCMKQCVIQYYGPVFVSHNV
jgi:hypothetical protein